MSTINGSTAIASDTNRVYLPKRCMLAQGGLSNQQVLRATIHLDSADPLALDSPTVDNASPFPSGQSVFLLSLQGVVNISTNLIFAEQNNSDATPASTYNVIHTIPLNPGAGIDNLQISNITARPGWTLYISADGASGGTPVDLYAEYVIATTLRV